MLRNINDILDFLCLRSRCLSSPFIKVSFELRKIRWDVIREPVTVGRRNRFLKSEAEVRRTEVGTQFFLLVLKSKNSWAHSAMANQQISEVCQSSNRKSTIFLLLIPKSQIGKFSWYPSPKRKPANLQGKNSVSDPDPHCFASKIFFYLCK